MGSGVDPSIILHALFGPRDRDNRFLSRFLKQPIIHPALLRGRERCTYPLPKQFSFSLDRLSRGLLLLRSPQIDGSQDRWGGLPMPSSMALLLKAAADAVREMRSLCQPDTARGGAPGPQVWTSHNPETVP